MKLTKEDIQKYGTEDEKEILEGRKKFISSRPRKFDNWKLGADYDTSPLKKTPTTKGLYYGDLKNAEELLQKLLSNIENETTVSSFTIFPKYASGVIRQIIKKLNDALKHIERGQ
jgi:hypothetical protein